MFTDRLTEIINSDWKYRPINVLMPSLKLIRYTLAQRSNIPEKRLLEKELGTLGKAYKGFYINLLDDGTPVTGGLVSSLNEITQDIIISCISRVAAVRYLTSSDIDSMIWQAKYCIIKSAVIDGEESGFADKLHALSEINAEELCTALNPLDILYSEDRLYKTLTPDTRGLYRKMTAEISAATGIPEQKLSKEYLARTTGISKQTPEHIGNIIISDYRRIFPIMPLKNYLAWLFICTIILTAFFSFSISKWAVLTFLPLFAIIKPIIDFKTVKSVRALHSTPSIELNGEVPESAKTLCVVSTILASEKDVRIGYEKLCAVKLRNNSPNIKYALLCDLKPSKEKEEENDKKIIAYADELFNELTDFIILIRERKYSKTQNLMQGRGRKRGAISDLVCRLRPGSDFARRTDSSFRFIAGEKIALESIKYIAALDFDTLPLMDSISELIGVALHPFYKDRGIIAPRITTTLSSYLKTGFSRAMSWGGGCAGASTYDSFSGDFYQDCFGEGIFTGKGLINVDIFAQSCMGKDSEKRFPPEKVLSHDILEGGCTGVVFAGGIEFSDSFPDTSNAFYKRQHRWLRGDLQNTRYIFDRRFSSLTRWKLADNVRRALTPVFILISFFLSAILDSELIAILTLLSIAMPFLMGFIPSLFRGRRFSNYRRFYSPVISQTKQLIRQLALEIMLTPKNALVSLDALLRTSFRMIITKKHLLDWATSAAFEGMGFGFKHMICAELVSLFLFILALLNSNLTLILLSVLFLSALPVMVYADKKEPGKNSRVSGLTAAMGSELIACVKKMWRFYDDYVTAPFNHLPPDNVQYSPVYRIGARTSPTNIGMYLLSVSAAKIMGFISLTETEERIDKTITSVEKLEKWHGNLMNWYDIENFNVISPFVSSVDSGNFVCCLVALKEFMKEEGISGDLIKRVENLIQKTDLRPFYNQARKLFSIGYDVSKNQLSRHHYDLIMSESRMLSYFAIASGQVDKKHWRSLGRIMGKDGLYAAPVAWTGTMFEYFMPELLLKSKEGSMEYEALKFSLRCQQKRGRETGLPFGISESGYYAFDEELNYQYKAHGVQAVGLKAGLNKERVISPYSSFLSLAYDPIGSYNNLVSLEKLGLVHPEYGFYEAVDFTKKRVGQGHAVIKSHMAHHIGMSIIGTANALFNGKFQDLFLADEKMGRAEELLEEKIIAGETVLGPPEFQKEEEHRMNAREFSDFSINQIKINPLSNAKLTLICTDVGISEGYYNHKSTINRTTDLLKPRGSLFALVENEYKMPFFWHPTLSDEILQAEQSVLFMQNSTEYYRNYRNLRLGLQVFLHSEKAVEFRKFAVTNSVGIKRQMTLSAYIEPALAAFKDIEAHPAFMDLFLKVRYDDENKLFLASRMERVGSNKTVMAVGFIGNEDFTFSLGRENVISRNGGIFSSMEKAEQREINTNSVPSPCIFIKADFPLDAFGKKESLLFICYGKSEDEVLSIAEEIRNSEKVAAPSEEITSPLVQDTIYGRLTGMVLPHILFNPNLDKEAVKRNRHDIRALWRFGISGDRPIVLFEFGETVTGADGAIEMKKSLSLCQIDFDLIMLCENDNQKRLSEQIRAEICTEIFILDKKNLENSLLDIIRTAAISTLNSDKLIQGAENIKESEFLPLRKSAKPDSDERMENRFEDDKYIIEKPPQIPWCNVLASPEFGTLVSDKSLGFSWALNSRENKLTPWSNDLCSDNCGEMLIMKMNSCLYDLIDGSRAVFSPNKADYHGVVKGIRTKTSVRVYKKGMGKELTLEIENRSKKSRFINLAYYVEPVLGVSRSSARFLIPGVEENALIFTNHSNHSLSGSMVLSCDKKAEFMTSRTDFWSGEWDNKKIEPASDLIGSVIIKLELPPKHSQKIKFILCFTKNCVRPLSMLGALKNGYEATPIIAKNINTGDKKLDLLYKHWLPWQTIGCRMWARTGFYQNSGAYGFRDQLQDAFSISNLKPELTKRQIARACASQFIEGDVLHWWHDLLSIKKGVRTRYSDDLLWLPFVLSEYCKNCEDYNILNLEVYYADGELLQESEHEKYIEVNCSKIKENIYSHAKRALEKAYNRGERGLLLIGSGDWCDGYNNVGTEGKGESVWLAMFYILTAKKFIETSNRYGDERYSEKLEKRILELTEAIEENAWDGEYYLRAFYDNGRKMGSFENEQCAIDLLPQAFSVFAKLPNKQRQIEVVTKASELLVDYRYRLIRLFTPPFKKGKTWQEPGYVMSYPEGVRENGGQYTHAAVWLALACHELGLSELADKLTKLISPFDRSEEYKTEPYYMTADIYTNPEAYGRGGWSIYTGSAGWYFRLIGKIYGD